MQNCNCDMEAYLTETNEKLKSNNYSDLTIVLGNESCDLDSAVCALVTAAYLHWQYNQIKCKLCTKANRDERNYKDELFLPMLNVNREDFALKTEIVFCFNEFDIDSSKLVFRDDFDLKQLVTTQKTNIVLVDHHVLAKKDKFLTPYVSEIIDHRPIDKTEWTYKEDTRSTIELVGSCATLVCERVKSLSALLTNEKDFFLSMPVCAELLHGTIILDTVNFSKPVNKATQKDEDMILFLESIIKQSDFEEYRRNKLEKLSLAKGDISKLTAEQLLKKDAKVVGHVYVPSFPILVEQVLKMPNISAAIKNILSNNHCTIALLLGMNLNGDDVERDAAIWCEGDDKINGDMLSKILQDWSAPNLLLSKQSVEIPNCSYYRQLNKSASRKQFMPAVQDFIEKCNTK